MGETKLLKSTSKTNRKKINNRFVRKRNKFEVSKNGTYVKIKDNDLDL